MALTIPGTLIRDQIRRACVDIERVAQIWVRDLISFVPPEKRARWAQALGLPSPLVITFDSAGDLYAAGDSSEPLSLPMTASHSQLRSLVLRIDEGALLKRRLELPAAAAARIDAALDMNLRTWTPFDPAEIYAAACLLTEVPRHSMRLQAVELRCVLRIEVDDRIKSLQRLGLDPDAIELGDARFQLPRPTLKRARTQRQSWLAVGLALFLFVQGVTAYTILASRQRDEIARLESARDERVRVIRQQAKLEKEVKLHQEGIQRIAARLQDGSSFSYALRLLGSALPHDAVIREFEAGRDRGEGHAVILGAPDMDIVAILSGTSFYRVGDLSVQQSTENGRRAFSMGFTVLPWAQSNGQVKR